jgi:hypothetical protein
MPKGHREKLPPIAETIADAREPKCCTFADLRTRAYDKADTGRYETWMQVGAAVEAEDCPDAIRRLAVDPMLTKMLTTRCWQARHKGA